jgi:cellulose synthase/poly-beta-1,6-N-acetylglucosamine synthase-like glycosyltransferase
MAAAGAGFACA